MCIVESARGKRKKRGSFFFSKNSLLTSAALLLHFSVYLSTRCDNKFSAVSTTSSTASTYCACLAFKFSLVSRARQHGQHTTSTKKKNGHAGLRVTLLLLHLQRGPAAVLSACPFCLSVPLLECIADVQTKMNNNSKTDERFRRPLLEGRSSRNVCIVRRLSVEAWVSCCCVKTSNDKRYDDVPECAVWCRFRRRRHLLGRVVYSLYNKGSEEDPRVSREKERWGKGDRERWVKYGHQIRPRVCWLSAHSSHSSRRGGLADSSSSSFSFLLSRFFLTMFVMPALRPPLCTVYCAYMYSALIWPGSNCHWRCTFLIFLLLFSVVLLLVLSWLLLFVVLFHFVILTSFLFSLLENDNVPPPGVLNFSQIVVNFPLHTVQHNFLQ